MTNDTEGSPVTGKFTTLGMGEAAFLIPGPLNRGQLSSINPSATPRRHSQFLIPNS